MRVLQNCSSVSRASFSYLARNFTAEHAEDAENQEEETQLISARSASSAVDFPPKRQRDQAENEVPQPQDLVAWGFTKTNPCCISVS